MSHIRDIGRVISLNSDILETRALEAYYSAIVWLPLNSEIRKHYFRPTLHPRITHGLPLSWDSCDVLVTHALLITSVAFSPDGSRFASGSWDRTARVWNAETGVIDLVLSGHIGQVNAVTFFPDGSRIATGSMDRTIRIWNSETGVELLQ